jgi:methionyl-tRNA formyltransferase
VGAHYADLPRIRGGDTVRWSVLLDHPLAVTHLFLAPALDMGDIVARTPVPVEKGDSIEDLRRKCRRACERGHLRVIDSIVDGTLEASPQRLEDGSTFYRMGRYLREKADRALADRAYSHYVDVKNP